MRDRIVKLLFASYIVSAFLLTGCGSSVSVRKIDDNDAGIPYYLPKPYLLITSGMSTIEYKPKVTETRTENPDGTKSFKKVSEQVSVTSGNDDNYSIKIIYLPDLRKTYGITIRPGSGTSETKIALANGWQLTSLASNTDTKIPETIEATAELASALGSAISPLEVKMRDEGRREISIRIFEFVFDKERNRIVFDDKNPVFEWPNKP